MLKSPRPAPFLACYLPSGLRLETAIARACAEGDAEIRAGAGVYEVAARVEAKVAGLAARAFAWGRRGAEIHAADPDAHAAAGEAAEAARLDGLEAEREAAEAEADGTPLRGPDPRGPERRISIVTPTSCCALVRLSCGHVREFNAAASYRVGDPARCLACYKGEPVTAPRRCSDCDWTDNADERALYDWIVCDDCEHRNEESARIEAEERGA